MPFAYDPQIAEVLRAALAATGPQVQPPAGDWKTLRANINAQMQLARAQAPETPGVTITHHLATAEDGHPIALRWFTKHVAQPGAPTGPAVLYIHGGGMICGSLDIYEPLIATYVAASAVPILAVEYRLAPEHPHPTPVEDCYAALRELAAQAPAWGIDPTRIAVMGDSAGGGLAASLAALARDRNRPLAHQILIYPMLDDRNVTPDPALVPFATWTYDNNITGWSALLGDRFGTEAVPPSAAPARLENLAGLPPAYLDIGELDIFRDETIAYAARLVAAGVSTEFHLHPGSPHGFDGIAPNSHVTSRAMADRIRTLAALKQTNNS